SQGSDEDEKFVERLAARYDFKFHVNKFNTEKIAEETGFSIQQAARKLRYDWFNSLAAQCGCNVVATAHHANDVAETMLINLVRGTGLAGMHGIPVQNGKVIRPLLFAERVEIEKFALENKLNYRTDSSNLTDDYIRNNIRHNVFPVLEKINPRVIHAFNKHAAWVRDYELLTRGYIADIEQRLVINHYQGIIKTIFLSNLKTYPVPGFLLFFIIGKYGFNEIICDEILTTDRIGARFLAPGFELIRDRDEIAIIDSEKTADTRIHSLDSQNSRLDLVPGTLSMEEVNVSYHNSGSEPIDFRSKHTAYIDADKVKFPLTVRRWKQGDVFHPFGMKGSKLVSDFLTDEKISAAEKEIVYLLLSGDNVMWIAGYRIDERYRLEKGTQSALKFTYTTKTGNNGS
ncbi:MAG TPA: tRNA lysidine(34) synthetase TilS, partial [Bacteroidia bacterium]|nr:tRNA lysidine(34) synthetase TilS [Bacteroidia bacterium]